MSAPSILLSEAAVEGALKRQVIRKWDAATSAPDLARSDWHGPAYVEVPAFHRSLFVSWQTATGHIEGHSLNSPIDDCPDYKIGNWHVNGR